MGQRRVRVEKFGGKMREHMVLLISVVVPLNYFMCNIIFYTACVS